MLARFTQIDYDREMALIAVVEEEGAEVEIGVARYVINPDGKSCEFAIVVADDWQHHSIAHRLMEGLMQAANGRDIELMEGDVLASNSEMLQLVTGLGFTIEVHEQDPGLRYVRKYL
jgi:acetyltransferase